MFKWMITGHRNHKQKSKFNTNNSNNNNRNSLNNSRNKNGDLPSFHSSLHNEKNCKIIHYSDVTTGEDPREDRNDQQTQSQKQQPQQQQPQQQQQQQQQSSTNSTSLHPQQILFRNSRNSLLTASRDTLNDSNEYTTLETLQAQRKETQESTEKSISETTEEAAPHLPYSRPPLPSAIGSQPNLHQCSSNQEFPQYLNSHGHHLGSSLQAPGTCTLPRRSVVREPPESRFRSPSNPPPSSRQPPPYSRHQPPEPFSRIRRPCQPPPPPRLPYGSLQSLEQQQQQVQPYHLEQRPLPLQEHHSHNIHQHNHFYQQLSQKHQQCEQQHKQQEQQQQQQKNSTEWNNNTELKSSTKIDDELQSQGNQLTDSWEPQSLLLDSENQHILPLDLLPSQSAHPSKSTEDLLHASRVPQNICNQASFNNNFHSEGSFPSQNKNEVLSSDSVYPENLNSQENLENSMDNQTHQAPIKYQEYILGVNDNHRDRRRIPLVQKNGPELITFKPSKETYQRHGYDSLPKDTRSHIHFNTKQPNQMINDTSNTKSHNQMRGLATNQNYVNEEELHIFEENDKEKNDKFHKNQKTNSNTEDESEEEIYIETKNKIGGADTLQVRDFQTYAEKEDQNGNSNNVVTFVDLEKEERHKGDGCTSSSSSTSSSWMEWTQQLQAYVAWVNSQLRKMPNKHLITDLRRDFQNGVVFADLIEILAGEKVAGITREADSSQLRRENIDRVLQFMAAKRIRMTHITNKEIMEGNLKSIMRVILALAAHYKPQSVQEGSAAANSQESTRTVTRSENNNNNNNNPEQNKKQEKTSQQTQTQKHMTSTKAVTHDVGVGPDTPFSPPDKTPNLIRRKITMIDEKEEQSCLPLRRQPSLANSVRPSSPTAPVYENLPKRSSLNRWAYDSLRASHKFYWASTSDNKSRNQQNSMNVAPKQHSLDDMSEDVFSNSFNTGSSRCSSLNTSVEVDDKDVAFPHGTRGPQNKPAALEFWQDLQSNDRSDSSNKLSSEETEIENPFKYHTIHRISGRRKLPQIPGQSSPSSNNSRGNTPVGSVAFGPSSDLSQGSTAEGDSHVNSLQNRNGNNIDDTSREPEGRSQNSSPATSLVRGPIIESWREMVGIEKSIDDLKDYYKDQLNGRETINLKDKMSVFGLHSLLESANDPNTKGNDVTSEGSTSNLRQEVLKQVIARRTLENEKAELTRHIAQRDGLICELRKQLIQKEKTLHLQRTQFEEAIRNIQNGKPFRPLRGESPVGRSAGREELQLVREAISALRGNFRGTDPNQHTLDTLEQAIAVLMERTSTCNNTDGTINKKEKRCSNASNEPFTKVIYFTDRTVTPFMSCINKRLGDVTLRDFKTLFDRPGNFRFHFKSHDPEYGLVKEEILNDDDSLPGVDGKIIAWVEEDLD